MPGMTPFASAPVSDRSVPLRPRAARMLPGLLGAVCLLLALTLPGTAQAQAGRWQWPIPPPPQVVHAFEAPDHPFGPGHRGIDIAAPAGGQVRSVEEGTVRFAGTVAGRGVVSVLHRDGLISTYEPVVASVRQGQIVGDGEGLGVIEEVAAAASHCTEQSCLHLGARQGEQYLDPLLLLGARGPSVLLPWTGPGGLGSGGATVPAQRAAHERTPRADATAPHSMIEPSPAAAGAPRHGMPLVAVLD